MEWGGVLVGWHKLEEKPQLPSVTHTENKMQKGSQVNIQTFPTALRRLPSGPPKTHPGLRAVSRGM